MYATRHSEPSSVVMLQKLTMFQRSVTVYPIDEIQLTFVKIASHYYLVALQHDMLEEISTSITEAQRCLSISAVLAPWLLNQPRILLVKYYYRVCQNHSYLSCFFDEYYSCLRILEYHASCFPFDHKVNLSCQDNIHCQNGGKCLQAAIMCPSYTMCVCGDCFFVDRCQFYAEGIGLMMDDILCYEIRPTVLFTRQSAVVQMSAAIMMLMFVIGLINSTLSLLTFSNKHANQVGCGTYLLPSSIISLLTTTTFPVKLWFLVLTQINLTSNHFVLHSGCAFLEPMLKVFLSMDSWLGAYVPIERAAMGFSGVNLKKTQKSSDCSMDRCWPSLRSAVFILTRVLMSWFI